MCKGTGKKMNMIDIRVLVCCSFHPGNDFTEEALCAYYKLKTVKTETGRNRISMLSWKILSLKNMRRR